MNKSVTEGIAGLRASVAQAALRSRRRPEEIQIVLVTKTVSPERIREAAEAGVQDFAENRVQELLEKKQQLASGLRWHMIGHLQTNKLKPLLGEVVLIHSLDRLDLAREMDRQAGLKGLEKIDCLIQVNASGETTKSGLKPLEVEAFADLVKGLRLRIRGLMTIGPLTDDAALIRACFRSVRRLQEDLKTKRPDVDWGILSMGMSGDYGIAIEEGANLIRIGTAVFGSRL